MDIPVELKYTKTHEWVRLDSGHVRMGITSHAQQELRDVVFVELPSVGTELAKGQACAVVESVKAAFDIYAPVSGTVTAINSALEKTPQLVNQDCYGGGWFFEMSLENPNDMATLFSAADYEKLIGTGSAH